jgi:hypothetical protein
MKAGEIKQLHGHSILTRLTGVRKNNQAWLLSSL